MDLTNDAGVDEKSSAPDSAPDSERTLIACVGASAGGVDALQRLCSNLPGLLGIGFVVLQHLAPDRESLLPELIGRISTIPVEQATDGVRVQPNHVYVIPPNCLATIEHGCVRLAKADMPHRRHQIDDIMRSLADDQGDHAVGIVLSGTGEDGTEGLHAIKGRGGLAIVQEPSDAQFQGMPQSAASSGHVEHVLPILGIIELLERYVDRSNPARPATIDDGAPEIEGRLEQLFVRLREQTGHDFHQYKRSTILRRIRRRMDIGQIDSIDKYIALVLQDSEEAKHFAKDLLIGVTQFFRDREVFDELDRKFAVMLSQGAGKNGAIRVWVVGCATGEEAYSIGMLIREQSP